MMPARHRSLDVLQLDLVRWGLAVKLFAILALLGAIPFDR